ncbi:MAG: phosphoenolpyruvate synthase [Magnetococcales bacterium]|nr:phosphoenolpyruvate synthase [Magnetococcales bacterium]
MDHIQSLMGHFTRPPFPTLRRLGPSLLAFAFLTFVWALPMDTLAGSSSSQGRSDQAIKYAKWVKKIKSAPRGPFKRIRWFCKDGAVLPPKPYGCGDRGGGIQHGELTDQVKEMRRNGYYVANVLAELKAAPFLGSRADLTPIQHMLIERFLRTVDRDWIFRASRHYRGALQIEDEESGSLAFMLDLLADPTWTHPNRYPLLRELARLLPIHADAPTAAKVRALSLEINDSDAKFRNLRIKIHGSPEASDASRVRKYASERGKPDLKSKYAELAKDIDSLYASSRDSQMIQKAIAKVSLPKYRKVMGQALTALNKTRDPYKRLPLISGLLRLSREAVYKKISPKQRLMMLRAGLALEKMAFTEGTVLANRIKGFSRRQRLSLIEASGRSLFGSGLISERQFKAIQASLGRLQSSSGGPNLDQYRKELLYLGRAVQWSDRTLAFFMESGMKRLGELEPMARLYIQDRLRGSPLILYGKLVDSMIRDANQLAKLEHHFFGRTIGVGLRALNPGSARGVLKTPGLHEAITDPNGVYLLSETIADLPPVAGILTQGEGNSLSHIQLLARNLGIPNAVINDALIADVKRYTGKPVILSVNAKGVVSLEVDPNPPVRTASSTAKEGFKIEPDLNKLDLSQRSLLPLTQLRSKDSGRVSGPKSVNLGELAYRFPDQVPFGFVIPFGAFKAVLDQPMDATGLTTFEWMKQNYRQLEKMPKSSQKRRKMAMAFLEKLRHWIENVDPGPAFKVELNQMLSKHFGPDGSFGVFVRSDTNVEDLPGFTGAGLNKTVANVVGYDNILEAIRQVWASPFTHRAFSWRQDHMDQPEFVFPAVLVQYSFPSEKSGVMVTADVEWNEPGWISVAVNEGIGGAVDGQAAEALRVSTRSDHVQLLSQASAPLRRALEPKGGLTKWAATGDDHVLQDTEIKTLVAFAKGLPDKFPDARDDRGNPAPMDVEFAFRDGHFALLQIRPFVDARSKAPRERSPLESMTVPLNRVP